MTKSSAQWTPPRAYFATHPEFHSDAVAAMLAERRAYRGKHPTSISLKQLKNNSLANFYQLVSELPGEGIVEKFNLFTALTLIKLFHPERHAGLLKAIDAESPNQIAQLLAEHEAHYQLYRLDEFTHSLQNPSNNQGLDVAIDTPFDLGRAFKQPLVKSGKHLEPLRRCFNWLEHDCSATEPSSFFRRFAEFIKHYDGDFSYAGLSYDIQHVIFNFIGFLGKQGPLKTSDGAAGCGLLALDMAYSLSNTPSCLAEQQGVTDSPRLANLGKQLFALRFNGQVAPTRFLQLAQPLNQHDRTIASAATPIDALADVYISVPPTPGKLSESQREARHSYLKVFSTKPLPSYDTDPLWVQYALNQIKPDGLAFVVVQDGFLKRAGYDAQVRQYLVETGLLVAVIALHPNHAKQTQYNQLNLLVLNNNTQTNPNREVYFWYLRNHANLTITEYEYENGHGPISDEDQITFDLGALPFISLEQKEYVYEQLRLEKIEHRLDATTLNQHNYNLSFEYYLSTERTTSYPDLNEAEAHYQQAKAGLLTAMEGFEKCVQATAGSKV